MRAHAFQYAVVALVAAAGVLYFVAPVVAQVAAAFTTLHNALPH